MYQTKILVFFLIFNSFLFADLVIEVDISEQRLYVLDNNEIKASYPISSSKYGEGSQENSFKTPLGAHEIKEKIGSDTKINNIFISRINTKRSAEIIHDVIAIPISLRQQLHRSRCTRRCPNCRLNRGPDLVVDRNA